MPFETIQIDVADGVQTVTLNRPDKLNAFTPQMMRDLLVAFDRSDRDDAVRAVIVTGAGRGFCAGADLSNGAKAFAVPDDASLNHGPDGAVDYGDDALRDAGGRVTLRIFESVKPVIAAINGPAVGIGATMAAAMDMRLASTAARIGFVFARRGLVMEAASSWFLPRLVGPAQALEWCMTGRVFDAHEALAGRFVSQVTAPDALLPAARQLAREIADNTSPVACALMRQMIWRMLGADHPMEAHKIDSRGVFERGRSADVREGVDAFLEKRPARFPDRVSKDMPPYFPWWGPRPYA